MSNEGQRVASVAGAAHMNRMARVPAGEKRLAIPLKHYYYKYHNPKKNRQAPQDSRLNRDRLMRLNVDEDLLRLRDEVWRNSLQLQTLDGWNGETAHTTTEALDRAWITATAL